MNWSTTHENNRAQYPQTCILWIPTLFFAEKAIQTSINELYWTVPFIGDRQKKNYKIIALPNDFSGKSFGKRVSTEHI